MSKRLSSSDRNANRTAMPGTKPQKPTKKFTIRSADRKRILAETEMNFGGVAGGLPSQNIKELLRREKAFREQGAIDSANAVALRIRNIHGSKKATQNVLATLGVERAARKRQQKQPHRGKKK